MADRHSQNQSDVNDIITFGAITAIFIALVFTTRK
jgi:hypothetical protein